MATLEKIRSKSVLLLVIIGAALLAFILGDFFNSGRTLFGTGTTVAQVGSAKIDIQEFQRAMEAENQRMQNSGQKVESAVLQQQVLNNMIAEKLFNDELNSLGLVVTDKELSDFLFGAGSARVNAMVQQQFGVESAAQLHDMAMNPSKYGIQQEMSAQLMNAWVQLEKDAEKNLLQGKFFNLFYGSLVANELDAKAIYEDNGTTSSVIYASVPYASLSDSDSRFAVSDADVQKEWEENKNVYKLDEQMRTINYVSVEIAPSPEDVTRGEKRVEDALAALSQGEGLEGIADFTDFLSERRKVPASALQDARMKAFADSAAVGSAKLVSRMGNDFTLARLFGRTSEVDSVNLSMVSVSGGKAQVDSVLTALKGGLSIDSLGRFSSVQGAQDSVWVTLSNPQLATFKDAIQKAETGVYFTPDSTNAQGGVILRVRSRKPAVSMVDLAIVDYTIEPSAATINTLQARLQEFLNANTKAADFEANATKAGYQLMPARITASTPGLTGIAESRDVVAWAMKAKKGKVSPIFGSETTGHLVAAALDDIYNDFIPATNPQVKEILTAKVRNDKKAAALIEQYKGKASDVAGYAKLMNSKVDSAQVTFGQISLYNPGFGGPEVGGIVSATPKGVTTAPLKGVQGVYVVQVLDVEKSKVPFNFEENALFYNRTRGGMALQMGTILVGNKKIKNNLLKFFQN